MALKPFRLSGDWQKLQTSCIKLIWQKTIWFSWVRYPCWSILLCFSCVYFKSALGEPVPTCAIWQMWFIKTTMHRSGHLPSHCHCIKVTSCLTHLFTFLICGHILLLHVSCWQLHRCVFPSPSPPVCNLSLVLMWLKHLLATVLWVKLLSPQGKDKSRWNYSQLSVVLSLTMAVLRVCHMSVPSC